MRIRRAILVFLLSAALVLSGALPALPADPESTLPAATVLIDGSRLDADAYIISGRTLVPLRAIFETLGATVAWDGATRTVTATRGATVIKLTIDQAGALVNGQPVALAVPAMIIGDRTFVPLRFVSEALGAEVGFDAPTRTVTVRTGQAVAPGGAPAPGGAALPGPAAAPGAAAAALAGALVGAPDLKQAVAATREALARGGVATADGNRVLVPAAAPAAAATALPVETVHLAMEARQRQTAGTLTLARLGTLLKDLGWPFRTDAAPGEQLVQFLAAWTAGARQHPDDPRNFTPLFLAELARRQAPPVDLAAGSYRPEELRLTALELQLIAAHFDRLTRPPQTGGSFRFGSVARAAEPCTAAKDWLGEFGGPAWKVYLEAQQVAVQEGLSAGLQRGLQQAGVSSAGAERFGKALSAMAIAARLLKLAQLYKNVQLEVTVASENPLHKATMTEAPKYSAFIARAGLSDRDWADYQQGFAASEAMRALRDCFGALGLPVLPDLGDLSKDVANWRVEWRLVEGSPEHAFMAGSNIYSHAGQLQMQLQPEGSHSGTASLDVQLTPEPGEHAGKEKTARVTAQATLETSAPISLSTLVNALKGGGGDLLALGDALAEVAAGWFQEMKQPTAYATLQVTYHPGTSWQGTLEYSYTFNFQYVNQTASARHQASVRFAGTEGTWSGSASMNSELTGSCPGQLQQTRGQAEGSGRAVAGVIDYMSMTNPQPAAPPGERDGSVSVFILPDGTYTVGFSVPVQGTQETFYQNQPSGIFCKTNSHTRTEPWSVVMSGSGQGRIDPRDPNTLSGSKTERNESGATWTLTWKLTRGE